MGHEKAKSIFWGCRGINLFLGWSRKLEGQRRCICLSWVNVLFYTLRCYRLHFRCHSLLSKLSSFKEEENMNPSTIASIRRDTTVGKVLPNEKCLHSSLPWPWCRRCVCPPTDGWFRMCRPFLPSLDQTSPWDSWSSPNSSAVWHSNIPIA